MDFNVIADSLDRMAVQQAAIGDAAKAFRELGSLEGHKRELERDIVHAQDTIRVAKEQCVEFVELAKTKAEDAQRIEDTAKAEAEGIVANAHADAHKIVASANEKAAVLIEAAQVGAGKLKSEVEESLAETIETVANLRVEAGELARQKKESEDAVAAATAQLDKIKEQIGKLAEASA